MTWNNIVTTPHRWMAYYLRRRGWVCFYLEPRARTCPGAVHRDCWLALYEESEARDLAAFVARYLEGGC